MADIPVAYRCWGCGSETTVYEDGDRYGNVVAVERWNLCPDCMGENKRGIRAMATRVKKKKRLSPIERLDATYGKKRGEQERKEGKLARKRLKDFTTITPVGKKTQWHY